MSHIRVPFSSRGFFFIRFISLNLSQSSHHLSLSNSFFRSCRPLPCHFSLTAHTNLAYIIDIVCRSCECVWWECLNVFFRIVCCFYSCFRCYSVSIFLFFFWFLCPCYCLNFVFLDALLFSFISDFFFRYKISKYILILSGIYKVDLHILLVYVFFCLLY